MRTSVWKATTAAALGLAVLFALRPPWPRHAAAATVLPEASSSSGAETSGRAGDATAAAAIVEASRARSHVYVRRCAITELRHVGGEPALQRLLEATHD